MYKARVRTEELVDNNEQAVEPEELTKICDKVEGEKRKLESRYNKKLAGLLSKEGRNVPSRTQAGFINKSTWVFTSKQTELMNKGPNHIVPENPPDLKKIALDLINAVEAVKWEFGEQLNTN